MKNIYLLMLVVMLFSFQKVNSQDFVELKNGESAHIDGMMVSYTAVKKGNKKGSDKYLLTASITNQGADYIRIFNESTEQFIKEPHNALAYFQFTNANGKALSATSAHFYPDPKYIKVSYKCKKCPPIKKDEDPYNHNSKSVIIGTQFYSGSTKSKSFHIRVPEGEVPKVRVLVN